MTKTNKTENAPDGSAWNPHTLTLRLLAMFVVGAAFGYALAQAIVIQ